MQTGKGGERDAQGEGEPGPAPPRWCCRRSGCWRCARRGGGTGRALRRDGPAAQLGRAAPRRSATTRRPRPDRRQGLTSAPRSTGRLAYAGPPAAGLRLSRVWSPHPAQSAGCRAEGEGGRGASPFPVTPVEQYLKAAFIPPRPVLCALPGRRWRQSLRRAGAFPRRQAARWPLPSRVVAAAPEDGKKRQGSGISGLDPAPRPDLGQPLRSARWCLLHLQQPP